jgi:hypothetical protein
MVNMLILESFAHNRDMGKTAQERGLARILFSRWWKAA